MGVLMSLGAVFVVLGLAGSAKACLQNGGYSQAQRQTQPTGQTDTLLTQGDELGLGVVLAPLSGLFLATGVVCLGIGAGHWKRPISSDVRPANPWSDQPGKHGDPPKGLV